MRPYAPAVWPLETQKALVWMDILANWQPPEGLFGMYFPKIHWGTKKSIAPILPGSEEHLTGVD